MEERENFDVIKSRILSRISGGRELKGSMVLPKVIEAEMKIWCSVLYQARNVCLGEGCYLLKVDKKWELL